MQKVYLKWQVGYTERKEQEPESFVNASVPGAAQWDCANENERLNWTFADRYKMFSDFEDKWFIYKSSFDKPSTKGEKVFFNSNGIDYDFSIYINGEEVYSYEGMFRHTKLDISQYLKDKNTIQVVIAPVPKSHHGAPDRAQADHSVKPPVSYGWDWHPRLIPSGIWDETFLSIELAVISNLNVRYTLQEQSANIVARLDTHSSIDTIETLVIKDDTTVYSNSLDCHKVSNALQIQLNNIDLWWPKGYGEPHRYTLLLQAKDVHGNIIQKETRTIGFRTVRLVLNKGTEKEMQSFPKSKRHAPITLEVNGVRIFALGTNWVNPSVFPGQITSAEYKYLIDKADEANFNLLRVWGGGITNKDFFYEYCDQIGMMVWQEFPLSCNNYPDDPKYLEVLKNEASAIVNQLKHHPSIVLWCGGNELYNSWSGMTEQSLALRLLDAVCLEHNPETPFIPTSPVDGMAHGHYLFYDELSDEDIFQVMYRAKNTAYTEFGVPSPSNVNVLEEIIPKDELFPPSEDSIAWTAHHGFGSWQKHTWLCQNIIEKYFGKAKNLPELVSNGQLLQSIGYKAIYETARQQWPYCSMALNWCFNEPWPSAANNSLIHSNGETKPAFDAIKQSCRPSMASASFPKFEWQVGEELNFNVFVLNNSPNTINADNLEVVIDGKPLLTWHTETCRPNEVVKGPKAQMMVEDTGQKWIEVELRFQSHPQMNSKYLLLRKKVAQESNDGLLNQ